MLDLESAFLSSGENLQSLMRAFYPSNNFPALWVKVIYSTNDSVSNENYTFYWSSSPVLVYLHPLILEGMSLLFFNDDYTHSESRLMIPSFCEGIDHEETIHILNDATVWLRSYVAARSINPQFEGHSIYREDDHFEVIKEYSEYNYLYVLFHICGIAIASLVNPLEVLNKIIFLLAIMVPVFFSIVHTIEGLETGKISFPNLPYAVILFVLFIIFFMLFFFSYVNVVLFAAVDNYMVVSALSQAIPVLLVGITIGLAKAEYKNYKNAQNNNGDAEELLCSNGGNDQPV
uniref:Uncharacterized protein n=1 Tax=Amphimedon queenslandica TaxID=400682 RepID=A0A1X7USL5_AMPQE